MSSPQVLLIGVDTEFRTQLYGCLQAEHYDVHLFATGEEAVAFADKETQPADFAFIDLPADPLLQEPPALETTRRLVKINSDMCVVVLSDQPDASKEEGRLVRAAGARRCIHKQAGTYEYLLACIKELGEMRVLRQLAETDEIRRAQIAATLSVVAVGTLLVDREGVPWAANDEWRAIEEKTDRAAWPVYRLADSLNADPLRRELVRAALAGQPTDVLALHQIGSGRLKYLSTWARPVRSQNQVVACSLSVVDESNSVLVRQMRLEERLGLIAEAILRAGYDRAQLYRVEGAVVVGIVERGGRLHIPRFKGYRITFDPAEHVGKTLKEGQPCVLPLESLPHSIQVELNKRSEFLCLPLGGGGDERESAGLLLVDREATARETRLSEEDVRCLVPYAMEAWKAISETPETALKPSNGDKDTQTWFAKIAACSSPQEAMTEIIQTVRRQISCDMAFIRVCQGDNAVVVARDEAFPLDWPVSFRMNQHQNLTIRAIQNQQPIIVQNQAEIPDHVLAQADAWSQGASNAFRRLQSFAIFPFRHDDTAGALVVLAQQPNHFTPDRRLLLEKLARVAAMACVDRTRSLYRQAAQRQETMSFQTVHNMRQHSTALGAALKTLLKKHTRKELSLQDAVGHVQDALTYLTRIEQIISGVLRYLRPLELRREHFALRELVEKAAQRRVAQDKVLPVSNEVPATLRVQADKESLGQVFDELFANAAHFTTGVGQITVRASFPPASVGAAAFSPRVVVTVEDNGDGVPLHMVKELFKPWKTTREGAGGTGVGLAFVERTIKEHECEVWHEPVDPHGARFAFTLPLSTGEDAHD